MPVTACTKKIDGCRKSPGNCCTVVSNGLAPSRVVRANTATSNSATSLNNDSAAIATTMPGWCSVASIPRVPNRMANTDNVSAIRSVVSKYQGGTGPGGFPVSTSMLMEMAVSCSAM